MTVALVAAGAGYKVVAPVLATPCVDQRLGGAHTMAQDIPRGLPSREGDLHE
jgi:hypothetical protein